MVSYSTINTKDNSWCRIVTYKSTPYKGSIDLYFNSEWDFLVAKTLKTNTPPQMNEPNEEKGWKIKAASGALKFNNIDALVMITTFTGYNKCFSISATCNKEKYINSIQNFTQLIELKDQRQNSTPVVKNNTNNNSNIIGSWDKYNSVSQINNQYGAFRYNKQQYYYSTNGEYTFLGKNYSEDYAEAILIKKNVTYTISGNQLQINPKSSVIESWSKKMGETTGDNLNQAKKEH